MTLGGVGFVGRPPIALEHWEPGRSGDDAGSETRPQLAQQHDQRIQRADRCGQATEDGGQARNSLHPAG
jgi:hypothetical protein